jgi:hypothetical protein
VEAVAAEAEGMVVAAALISAAAVEDILAGLPARVAAHAPAARILVGLISVEPA